MIETTVSELDMMRKLATTSMPMEGNQGHLFAFRHLQEVTHRQEVGTDDR